MSYEEIAERSKMPSGLKARYVLYMRTRWEKEEDTQCKTGYAREWAERFLSGSEYECSDSIGQAVLKGIDGGVK